MSKFGASTWRFVRSGKEIVYRNCAERNETLTKKNFGVRENFARTKQTVKANLQGSVCVKRLTKDQEWNIKKSRARIT